MWWVFSAIGDVAFWVLLFFSNGEVDNRWRVTLAIAWFVLWAITYLFPGTALVVMAVVAIVDIGLLYAIFGDYAVKV